MFKLTAFDAAVSYANDREYLGHGKLYNITGDRLSVRISVAGERASRLNSRLFFSLASVHTHILTSRSCACAQEQATAALLTLQPYSTDAAPGDQQPIPG